MSSCIQLRWPLLHLLCKQMMNALSGLALYSFFSSAYFPSELKVLPGDVPLLTLKWSQQENEWIPFTSKCSPCLPLSTARQKTALLPVSSFFLFHLDSLALIFRYLGFDFWKGRKGVSDERGRHDRPFTKEEKEKVKYFIEWMFAEGEQAIQWHRLFVALLWSRMKFPVVRVQTQRSCF